MRSRAGDQINVQKELGFQPNEFLDSHVLRSAYMQVVQQKCLRAGIDSVHKELGMLSVVAAGARCLQEKWVKNLLEESIMGPRRSVFINRFYDSTPWHVSFGRLQQQFMPLARYFWWNEAEDRWVVTNFDEYKEKYPAVLFSRLAHSMSWQVLLRLAGFCRAMRRVVHGLCWHPRL